MSEQARIETAIDTTIDNCEVLRARLAKYEDADADADADGKPITTIAEQAREIERLGAELEDVLVDWGQIRLELAAMKAQPSGVVLPERDDASAYEAFYAEKAKTLPLPLGNTPLRYSGGQYINDFALFGWMVWEACLSEVARLNQPASAGDRETLSYLMERFDNEVWVCQRCSHEEPTNDMDSAGYLREYLAGALTVITGVVDERVAFEAWRLEKFCGGVERLKKCSNAPDVYYYTAEQEAWMAWSARAALSANHSEQVQVPRVATPEMKAAIWAELDRQGLDSDLVETQSLYFAGIAAAPSAACQHRFMFFGDQPKRRCADCCAVEDAAPSAGSQKEQG
ncbi:hypothetical protein [Pseudomonas sp. GWSMS-1]|uniref:hypothetical protein n=1 Tax=Pseudomonas sp. GWSMS-1 TaxID=3308997 RepID=UPI003CFB2024